MVQQLLAAEAKTDLLNDDTLTPAMLSAQEGNLECLHFLLSCDPNCTQRNQLGKISDNLTITNVKISLHVSTT